MKLFAMMLLGGATIGKQDIDICFYRCHHFIAHLFGIQKRYRARLYRVERSEFTRVFTDVIVLGKRYFGMLPLRTRKHNTSLNTGTPVKYDSPVMRSTG